MDAVVRRAAASRVTNARSLLARVMALVLAVSTSGALVVLAAAPAAAAEVAFDSVYHANLHGDIQIRGNTALTCPTASGSNCMWARTLADEGEPLTYNDYQMTYQDVDQNASTINSSSATVDIPAGAVVRFAALTWGGDNSRPIVSNLLQSNRLQRNGPVAAAARQGDVGKSGQVLMALPGTRYDYQPVIATTTNGTPDLRLIDADAEDGIYSGYANVTGLVQRGGSGSYTVADVQTSEGKTMFGGWALTIAYEFLSPTADQRLRSLEIAQGFGHVGAGGVAAITVKDFITPKQGVVNTTLGTVAFGATASVERANELLLGRLDTVASLKPVHDDTHRSDQFFGSVISEHGTDCARLLTPPPCRDKAYPNEFGLDASTVDVPPDATLGNGATQAVIRMKSRIGNVYPRVVTFATDLYAPDLTATKSFVVDKADGNLQAGVAEPGDTLRYTVTTYNAGTDAATQTVLTDLVPPGTQYLADSLKLGATPRDPGTTPGTISVDIGDVPKGGFADPVVFDVVVDPTFYDVYGAGPVRNTADLSYRGDPVLPPLFAQSNTVETPVARHESDLAVTKTPDKTLVQRGAQTLVTYTLTVTDAGLYPDPGATVTDTLPANAVLVGAVPSQGTCTTPLGAVVCALGLVGTVGTVDPVTVDVTMTLDAAPDPAADTATVVGTNFDPNLANNTSSVSTAVNTAPVAVDDAGTTAAGTVTVPVLKNDTDADGDALSVWSVATAPVKGHAVINPDGTITYTAAVGAVGTDTFHYVVHDLRGGSATATVTITIPNSPPVAVDDPATAIPGQPVTVAVLDNDTDVNIDVDPYPDRTLLPRTDSGQSLSVSAFSQPSGGEGVVTSDGKKLTFTPSAAFRKGVATFTYTASDGATPVPGTDEGTVTVTVPDVAPVATPDAATTPYVTPVTVDVLANDLDDNHDPLTVTGVTPGAHGSARTVVIDGKTQVRYTPEVGWSGVDVMTYTITDGATTTDGKLTVTTLNAPPTADSFGVTVDGGVATEIPVLVHAADPNGDHLTVTGIGYAGSGGVASVGGNVRYTPQSAFRGDETFTYTVSDTKDTATGTVTVHVRNQAPKPVDDSAVVPINGSVTIDVLANDTDPNGDTLTIDGVAKPPHGTAAIVAGKVVYTPDRDFGGSDPFVYTVGDGHGGQATATVGITLQNGAPVANPDSAIAAGIAGSAVTIDVLPNDTDPNEDPLTIESVTNPLHGSAAIVAGKVVYTPVATYVGQDWFDYTINDGRGAKSSARVTVDVQNVPPVAVNDDFSASTAMHTPLDVLANDTDANGETLSVLSVSPTSGHGTVTIVGTQLDYVSANSFVGDDTFTYVVTDPRDGTATGTVTVHAHNASPVAPDRTATTATNTPVNVNLLEGVSDPDGQPVAVTATTAPSDGSLSPPAAIVTYTPHTGFSGTDVFTYTVSDGQGGLTTRNVVVTVDDANPVAGNHETSTAYNTRTAEVNLLAGATDLNIPGTGQFLTVDSVELTIASAADATFAWTLGSAVVTVLPLPGFVGDVVLRYGVSDNALSSGSAADGIGFGLLTVHVAAPAAMAIDDDATTPYLTPVPIDVLANDRSGMGDEVLPTLDALSLTSPVDAAGVTRGTLTADGGVVTYAPSVGWSGKVTFRYTMRNPLGGTGTAMVTVTVGNAAPVAVDDDATTPYDTTKVVDVLANDTDPNIPVTAQKLTVTEVVLTQGSATVTINDDGLVEVNPDPNFAGDVVVDYVISDGAGGSSRATLTVTVGVPMPTAVDKTASTPYETPVTVDVLKDDSSGQVDIAPTLIAESLSIPYDSGGVEQGGVAILDGMVHYQPKAGFSGDIVFDYTISNPLGGTDSATVTVTVRPESADIPSVHLVPAVTVPAVTDPAVAHPVVAGAVRTATGDGVRTGVLAHTGADLDLGGAAGMLLVVLGTVGVLFARSRRPGRQAG